MNWYEKCHIIINTYYKSKWFIYYGPSWPWSYGSWTYNYLCNQCILPLVLWVRFSIRARYTTVFVNVCPCLPIGRWFSLGPPVSSTNKIQPSRYSWNIVGSGVKLYTIKQTNKHAYIYIYILCKSMINSVYRPIISILTCFCLILHIQ